VYKEVIFIFTPLDKTDGPKKKAMKIGPLNSKAGQYKGKKEVKGRI